MTVKVINRSSNPLPQYATPLSAGLDVRADNPEPIVLGPLCRAMVPTGLFLEIPAGKLDAYPGIWCVPAAALLPKRA